MREPGTPTALSASKRVEIVLGPDGLEARLTVLPGPPYPDARPEDVIEELHRHGVRHGLRPEGVDEIVRFLAAPGRAEPVAVARGEAPRRGEDGRLELRVREGLIPGRLTSEGRRDYRDRGHLVTLELGQEVALYRAPTPGVEGRRVDGTTIPSADGKDTLPRLGEGIALGSDGVLSATRSGVLSHQPGREIDVTDAYTHDANVDLSSGHLDMAGTLVVLGDVQEEMCARSTRDVLIEGTVDGATVEARGSVTITGSVFAEGVGAHVHAGGDLAVVAARASNLEAKGTLRFSRELVDCRVQARAIEVEEDRARIVGGELVIRDRLRVGNLGSPGGAMTRVEIGRDPFPPRELVLKEREVELRRRSLVKGGDRAGRGRSSRRVEEAMRPRLEEKLQERRAQRALLEHATLTVLGTLHAGTRVRIGPHEHTFETDFGPGTLRYVAGRGLEEDPA